FQAPGHDRPWRYVAHTNGLTLKPPAGREDLPPPGTYTLFSEPTTRFLLSAEPLSLSPSEGSPWSESTAPSTAQLIQQALATGFPFTPDDLDCNRAGALSDAQRQRGRKLLVAQMSGGLIILLIMLAIAIPLGVSGLHSLRMGEVTLGSVVSVVVA